MSQGLCLKPFSVRLGTKPAMTMLQGTVRVILKEEGLQRQGIRMDLISSLGYIDLEDPPLTNNFWKP